jgi:transposase
MSKIATIGLDISKEVFQVHGLDEAGTVVVRRKLRRADLLGYFKKLEPCIVGIEACGGSQHWARSLTALGHEVKLIAPSFVRPYVKTQKNDAADAEAICEAIGRPGMRFVPIKTEEQQAILTLHRVRDLLTKQRTALVNAFRGHIAEYGHVARGGRLGVLSLIALLDSAEFKVIPKVALGALRTLAKEIRTLMDQSEALERKIKAWHRANPQSLRLAAVPGIGPLTATTLCATVPDPSVFKSGRHMAAWLGLVPRQYSTAGKPRLGRITKRGDRYLRRLLVLGARAVIISFKHGKTSVSPSIARLAAQKPLLVAAVALANKLARIAWALMVRNERYRWPAELVGKRSTRQLTSRIGAA